MVKTKKATRSKRIHVTPKPTLKTYTKRVAAESGYRLSRDAIDVIDPMIDTFVANLAERCKGVVRLSKRRTYTRDVIRTAVATMFVGQPKAAKYMLDAEEEAYTRYATNNPVLIESDSE